MGASFFQILQFSCYFWNVIANICHFPSVLILQGFKFSSQSVKFSGQLVFIFLKCIFLKTEFNKDNLGNGNGPLYICVTVFLIHCTQTWVWPVEVFIIHNKLCLKYLNKSDNGKYGQWENGEDDKSSKSSYPPSPCAFLCQFFLVCLWYILVFFEAPIAKAVQMFFQLTWFDLNSLCKLVTALSNLSSVCALGSVLVSLQLFFRLKTRLR